MEQHRDLVDAGIIINEGADGNLVNGKPIANNIELAQRVTTNYTLRVTNRGGHSTLAGSQRHVASGDGRRGPPVV